MPFFTDFKRLNRLVTVSHLKKYPWSSEPFRLACGFFVFLIFSVNVSLGSQVTVPHGRLACRTLHSRRSCNLQPKQSMMEWNVPKQLGRRSSLPGIEGKEIDLKGFVKMDGHFFQQFLWLPNPWTQLPCLWEEEESWPIHPAKLTWKASRRDRYHTWYMKTFDFFEKSPTTCHQCVGRLGHSSPNTIGCL